MATAIVFAPQASATAHDLRLTNQASGIGVASRRSVISAMPTKARETTPVRAVREINSEPRSPGVP